MNKEDIKNALEESANNGNIDAQIALALNKIQYEENVEEGINELIKLARDNEFACHNLLKVVNEKNLKKKYKETFEICENLAKQNKEIALIDYSVIFQLGILNKSIDVEKSINSLQKAVDLYQSGIASYMLSIRYLHGENVAQDLEKAYNYAKKGAETHNADCEELLAQMYLYGCYVKQNDVMASYWYEKAFEDGKASVALYLGNLYMPENNKLNDEEQALEWYYKGSCCNIPDCFLMMAYLYNNGEVVENNPIEAFNCYKKAAELGHPEGYFFVGFSFLEGCGTIKNELMARKYFEKAASLGYKDAIIQLKKLDYDSGAAISYNNETSSNVYLDTTTVTGLRDLELQELNIEAERKEQNREILRAAAATTGATGFINDNTGFFVDEHGNETYIDSKSGYIFNAENGEISFYDKGSHTVYNTTNGKINYLDVKDDKIFNTTSGKTSFTSGNEIL